MRPSLLSRPRRRRALGPLLLAGSLLAGCVPVATPGAVHTVANNPLVTIGAGQISVGNGTYDIGWYVIDTRAQVCWFMTSTSIAPMDCRALWRVPEAARVITWQTSEDSGPTAPPAAPTSGAPHP